jgi:hypothetical protein
MKSLINRRAVSAIEYLIVAVILVIMLFFVGGIGFNIYVGFIDRSVATKELGVEFLTELNVRDAALACQGYDTDADGYISCTYTLPGSETLHSIECAPGWFFKGNCRAQRFIVPNQPEM